MKPISVTSSSHYVIRIMQNGSFSFVKNSNFHHVGILVSEKSELQSTNSTMQKQLTAKDADLQGYGEQVKNFQQQCMDSQKEIQLLQTSNGQLNESSRGLIEERDKFSNKLYEVK